MKFKDFLVSFSRLVTACPVEELTENDRYVFLSDLHLGDGGKRDDMEHNRSLVEAALERWYLPRGYTLVLNGDIEDLNKFPLAAIRAAWPKLYELFDAFAARGRLRKIVGNHDLSLLQEKEYPYPLLHGLSLEKDGRRVFICHGHQASRFFVKYDYLSEFIVRYLAKPLRIKNSSISGDSRRRFAAERRIYRAARTLGLVVLAGHTHRPLFESLSKYDSLRWSIEELLREYAIADAPQRRRLAELVGIYRGELERLSRKELKRDRSRSLYGEGPLLVPCLFNSGCATGKHGFTVLEIDRLTISLQHWASGGSARPYIEEEALFVDTIEGACARYTLKSDNLDQVFARIELLGGRGEKIEEAEREEDAQGAVPARSA
jgi:predicted phosphodiesterase